MLSNTANLLQAQIRVIVALLLREMRTRFGKTPIGFLWAIAEPLILVAGASYLFVLLNRPPPYGNSMPVFFATGMLPIYLFRRGSSRLISVLNRGDALFVFPGITPVDAFVARAMLELVTYISVMIIAFTGMTIILGTVPPDRLEIMLIAVCLLALLAFGYGVVNALIAQFLPLWQRVTMLIDRLLIFTSAVFLPLDATPVYIRDWLVWNPVAHGVELFRSGYYMGYRCNELSVGYLLGFGLTMTLVGLAAERSLRMRSE